MSVRAAIVLIVLLPGSASAQVQGFPVEPTPLANPPARLLPPVVYDPPIQRTPVSCPIPAAPCGRDPFRNVTAGGLAITCFPQSLLWEPPLASRREPRFTFVPTTLSNDFTNNTLDANIGATVGLVRFEREDSPLRVQLDAFGVVINRVSQYDFLVDSDYRAGLPLTFALGPWHGKLAFEHTSSHLGDETIERTGRQRNDYTKDEIVAGLGRWLFADHLRVYGDVGWAVFEHIPDNPSPFRFDLGGEWRPRVSTGFWGEPFAAANLEFNGANGYHPSLDVQLGWLWRAPDRRLGQFRVYAEYFTGRSDFGQFFTMNEQFLGFGVAIEN